MDYTAAAQLVADTYAARLYTPITVAEAGTLCDLEAVIAAAFTVRETATGTDYRLRVEAERLAVLVVEHPVRRQLVDTALPCPAWCEHAAAHPFGWRPTDDSLNRLHRARYGTDPAAGTHLVTLETTEHTHDAAGPAVEHDGPHLSINGGRALSLDSLTAPQARALAAALLEAADALEADHPTT